MAGQAHYTSAPPSQGAPHGGFRFTAVSPAAQPALDVLRPLAGQAPPAGGDGSAEPPPVFAYDRPDLDTVVLTRTRGMGRDYTDRPGNHFCHALYAAVDELAGLRPVELWDAPLWAATPAPDDGSPLPDLAGLLPGSAVGPNRVRRLLDAAGEPGVRLLERLLTAALRALAGAGPGATLVSADPERVVDWIAAVSYTLPAGLAAHLTFTTCCARPQDSRRHLTGARPEDAERVRGPVLRLDRPAAHGCPQPSAAAVFLAGAWEGDRLDVVDAVAELWEAGHGAGPEAGVRRLRAACALLAPEDGAGPGSDAPHPTGAEASPGQALAALRVLRLYRQGLREETETYDLLRDLVRAERPERIPRPSWRRRPTREGE